MAFVDDLFLPLKAIRPFFLSVFFLPTLPASGITLPFIGVGVGFEEPHLQFMFQVVDSGFSRLPHNSVYTAHQGGLAPVVQVVNLEFYLCLSPWFEPQVGRTFDFICKNKNKKKDSIVESALQRG